MERYRIRPDAAVYFLTYSVVEWLPIFVSEAACKIVTDSLNFCRREKHLCLNAYVIMPTHMHMITFDSDYDPARLIQTLADFRKYTGRQLSDFCIAHSPKCFLQTLRDEAARIESAASGSPAATRKQFRKNDFGSRSSTIFTKTLFARDSSAERRIGGTLQQRGMFPMGVRQLMFQLQQSLGDALTPSRRPSVGGVARSGDRPQPRHPDQGRKRPASTAA